MKRIPLILAVICSTAVFAAAPVEERAVKSNPLEASQYKAEYTRNAERAAKAKVHSAEQDFREAEENYKFAVQTADEAKRKLESARKELELAQAEEKKAGGTEKAISNNADKPLRETTLKP